MDPDSDDEVMEWRRTVVEPASRKMAAHLSSLRDLLPQLQARPQVQAAEDTGVNLDFDNLHVSSPPRPRDGMEGGVESFGMGQEGISGGDEGYGGLGEGEEDEIEVQPSTPTASSKRRRRESALATHTPSRDISTPVKERKESLRKKKEAEPTGEPSTQPRSAYERLIPKGLRGRFADKPSLPSVDNLSFLMPDGNTISMDAMSADDKEHASNAWTQVRSRKMQSKAQSWHKAIRPDQCVFCHSNSAQCERKDAQTKDQACDQCVRNHRPCFSTRGEGDDRTVVVLPSQSGESFDYFHTS